ncbi:MAG: hypothetical protein IAE77_08500 [Prosthecobacter sp.]|uniref:hypothetical protein n=1 Tax=Prosthecobacter sp. TaxID=1965333 RepID=UPI0019DD87A4|nr:hypothetical protein [Prosthecobacter sp.]MBE2283489.1 hypothetical protein [Prosthecobacter sp.]
MIRLLVFLLLATSSAIACSVPVFRYALEHWPADAYRVTLPHGKTLAGNFQITHDEENRIELRQPRTMRNDAVIWSAEYSEDNVQRLADSPARKEIADRLSNGESAVWVLLESGDAVKDAEAAKFLDERLGYLAGVMELPKLDEQDIKNGLVSLPGNGLRVAFSTLRVKRDDPAEDAFVAMLLASEEDLREFKEPMVFPIFGQGRVLYALVGKGIKVETVDSAAQFLIGSCSCQVKEQNPGVDLVMAVDWKQMVKDQALPGEKLPELSQVADLLPQTVKIEAPPSTSEPPVKSDWRLVALIVAIVGLVLVLKRFWTRRP